MAAKAGAEPREQRLGGRKSLTDAATEGDAAERCACASPLEIRDTVLCAPTMEGPMRRIVLGVSALALALSGCSYFHGNHQGSAGAAQQSTPAATSSSSTG